MMAERSQLVIGSLPCTAFSMLHDGIICHRIDPESQQRKMAEARLMLGLVLNVCEWETRRRRHFLLEHPERASSWKLDKSKTCFELFDSFFV